MFWKKGNGKIKPILDDEHSPVFLLVPTCPECQSEMRLGTFVEDWRDDTKRARGYWKCPNWFCDWKSNEYCI